MTDDERIERASVVAEQLCDHKRWLTHGRSIKIDDLEKMRLRITNYAATPELADAIRRYHTLLQMTFAANIYKIFETRTSQIYRFMAPNIPPPVQKTQQHDMLVMDVKCQNCGWVGHVQANLAKMIPLCKGNVLFPDNNRYKCPNCGIETDLSDARRQIEMQTRKRIMAQGVDTE